MRNPEIQTNLKYNDLEIYNEADVHPSSSKMTKFTVRAEPSSKSNQLAAIVLGVLSAALLFVIIGLSVHIYMVSDQYDDMSLNSSIINSQLVQLQSDHRSLTESKNALQKKHDEDVQQIQTLQINLKRETDMRKMVNSQNQKLEEDQKKMQSQISTLEGGCGKCLPNWLLMNSTCFYFSVSSATPSQGWNGGRDDCKKKGADLVIIDSKEKQEFIIRSLKTNYNLQFSYSNGFWIGLQEEAGGTWKWLNKTTLKTGYWMVGEPNDYSAKEDCAAVYASKNPMQAWNDAPCSYLLQWICEKEAL